MKSFNDFQTEAILTSRSRYGTATVVQVAATMCEKLYELITRDTSDEEGIGENFLAIADAFPDPKPTTRTQLIEAIKSLRSRAEAPPWFTDLATALGLGPIAHWNDALAQARLLRAQRDTAQTATREAAARAAGFDDNLKATIRQLTDERARHEKSLTEAYTDTNKAKATADKCREDFGAFMRECARAIGVTDKVTDRELLLQCLRRAVYRDTFTIIRERNQALAERDAARAQLASVSDSLSNAISAIEYAAQKAKA